jgi:hypothetical protein
MYIRADSMPILRRFYADYMQRAKTRDAQVAAPHLRSVTALGGAPNPVESGAYRQEDKTNEEQIAFFFFRRERLKGELRKDQSCLARRVNNRKRDL